MSTEISLITSRWRVMGWALRWAVRERARVAGDGQVAGDGLGAALGLNLLCHLRDTDLPDLLPAGSLPHT